MKLFADIIVWFWMLSLIVPITFWGFVVTFVTLYKTEDERLAFYALFSYIVVVISVAYVFCW